MRRVLIIDGGNPCNKQTPYSHNFLTNDGKTPPEIARLAKQQVARYESVAFLDGLAASGVKTENGFSVHTTAGETFTAGKPVFATGIKDIMPDIPGFPECWGISVLHCPYCHGYGVKSQKTGIVGNGDDGFALSLLISHWTADLTLYTNGQSTLSAHQAAQLDKHHIPIAEAPIARLEHQKGYLQNIHFKDGSQSPVQVLYARRPFVQHCAVPQSLGCELTAGGYIAVDDSQKTTVEGVFACGDNTSRMRTVANAVAMGTTTGMMVNKELIEETF
jgi:thioredoxin reductase